jgi:hypothetical protein
MERLENQMQRKKLRAEKLQANVAHEIKQDPEYKKETNQLQDHKSKVH